MRYCPNKSCPARALLGEPAEFVDRVDVCSDCGTVLVAEVDVAVAGLPRPAEEPHGYRDPAAHVAVDDPDAARAKAAEVDVGCGILLIALGVLVPVVTYVVALAAGGGRWFFSLLPLGYGAYRLNRGLSWKAAKSSGQSRRAP
jgi:hypothetical protein